MKSDHSFEFAWTDASSEDSDMSLDVKLEDCSTESYSNEAYKRAMLEEANLQIKKRKHEHEIKSEPESDFDVPRKKKKKKHETSININSSSPNMGYLNVSIKEQQEIFTEHQEKKSKKKKKHKDQKKSVQKKNEKHETFDYDDSSLTYSRKEEPDSFIEPTQKNLKKKKKKKQNKDKDNDTTLDGYDSQSSVLSVQKVCNSVIEDFVIDTKDSANNRSKTEEELKLEQKKKNKKNKHKRKDVSLNNNIINEDKNKDSGSTQEIIKKKSSKSRSNSDVKILKISERLKFEDDDFMSVEDKYNDQNLMSKQMKQFVECNKHLKLISPNIDSDRIITDDDDVWIIKTPHEVDINAFKDKSLTLGSACKLKLNGQTYCGEFDDSVQKTPLLIYDKNKLVIKNVPIKGFLTFRRRIPEPYIPDYNIMTNNKPSFIPLPETKCRHPLLGINYKEATRIPRSIAERLNVKSGTSTSSDKVKQKNKKYKKEKYKTECQDETEQNVELLNMEQEQVNSSKKKQKRKHTNDENLPKKSKHIKPDPDTAEAWKSEQVLKNNHSSFK